MKKIIRTINWFCGEYLDFCFKRLFPKGITQTLCEKKNLIGVEIGVYDGKNALDMLKRLNIKKLYLIDPYTVYEDEYFTPSKNKKDLIKAKIKAKKRLSKYLNVEFIYKKSEDVKNEIPNNLDFVYIDGSHKYEEVIKDINFYYPKVKIGGVFAGHDIGQRGVNKAIFEFFGKIKKIPVFKVEDWIYIKE